MKKIFYLMAVAIAAMAFTACSENDDNPAGGEEKGGLNDYKVQKEQQW